MPPPTPTQLTILKAISIGVPLKRIAYDRKVSMRTIEQHSYNLKKRIKAETMSHAVAIAIREGWIE